MKGLEGNADLDKDKNITNLELIQYLKENVRKESSKIGRSQEPTFTGDQAKVILSLR